MESTLPAAEDLKDLSVKSLGEARVPSPLGLEQECYIKDSERIVFHSEYNHLKTYLDRGETPPMFERAGPREKLYFSPKGLICGIVTCGGLCPGLNDVIRTITLSCLWQYGVKRVLGFSYGYEGLSFKARKDPIDLTPDLIASIQHDGGTILGSSRGSHAPEDMVQVLKQNDVQLLFVIGGDGTFRGAHAIVEEIEKQNLKMSVVAVPKTIDNDIVCSETSFGFGTSVEEARKSIGSAHEEAKAAYNGVGLVKLMGRDSGFIAAAASLANSDVNFCLIPEVPVMLDGKGGFLEQLGKRLERRQHAVIVVAEGAGQELLQGEEARDASGNVLHKDIGLYLKQRIQNYFKSNNIPMTLKYIDPSYTIRSCPSNARDSIYCLLLGQNAVHAAMAGKTDCFIGYWNHHYTLVPLKAAINKRKKIDPHGILWHTLQLMNSMPARERN